MSILRRPALKASVIGIFDQGSLAITNLALVIFAAQGGVQSIAAFALVTALYFGLLTMARALLAEPLLALPVAKRKGPYLRIATMLSLAGGALAGLGSGVMLPFDGQYLIVGAVTFVLLVAEFLRIRAYAFERPKAALVGTLASVSIVLVAGLVDRSYDPDRWQRLLIYWALAGFVSSLLTLALTGRTPGPTDSSKEWYKTYIWKGARSLLLDAGGTVLITHASLYIISYAGGINDVAEIRALSTALSPLSLVFTGLTLSLTPLLSRTKTVHSLSTLRVFWFIVLGASTLGGGLALSVGQPVITALFGAESTPTKLTLMIAVLSAVLFAIGTPWLAQVRVAGRYGMIGWVRLTSSALLVAGLMAVTNLGNLSMIFFVIQGIQAIVIALTACALSRIR